MIIPLQLLVLSLPSLIYVVVNGWRNKQWRDAFEKIGWQGSQPIYFLWSLGLLILIGGFGWFAFQFVPFEILRDSRINISEYSGWKPGFASFLLVLLREAIYVALGEEIFFRGFLGGWLTRRLGFGKGNMAQALIFLLPHLPLLLVGLSLWPIIFVQLLTGWLLGWLCHRSGSVLPGWFAHSLTNALGALIAMTP